MIRQLAEECGSADIILANLMADSNTSTLISPAKKEQKRTVLPQNQIGAMGFFESGFETNPTPSPIVNEGPVSRAELSTDHQVMGSITNFQESRSREQESQSYGEFKISFNLKPVESLVDKVATSGAAVGGTLKEVSGDVSELVVNTIFGFGEKKETPKDPEKIKEDMRVREHYSIQENDRERVQTSKQSEVNNYAERLGLPLAQVGQEKGHVTILTPEQMAKISVNDVAHSYNLLVEKRKADMQIKLGNSVDTQGNLKLSLAAHEGQSQVTGPTVGS
jgi:hypothetical protein